MAQFVLLGNGYNEFGEYSNPSMDQLISAFSEIAAEHRDSRFNSFEIDLASYFDKSLRKNLPSPKLEDRFGEWIYNNHGTDECNDPRSIEDAVYRTFMKGLVSLDQKSEYKVGGAFSQILAHAHNAAQGSRTRFSHFLIQHALYPEQATWLITKGEEESMKKHASRNRDIISVASIVQEVTPRTLEGNYLPLFFRTDGKGLTHKTDVEVPLFEMVYD